VGGEGETIGERLRRGSSGSGMRVGGAILGGAVLVELFIALLGTGLKATSGYGAPYVPGPQTYGTPAYIGKLLLTRFLLSFELASFLLLVGAIGGVVLARRRGGIDEESGREPIGPLNLLRPRETGTTAEAVGTMALSGGRAKSAGRYDS
jgi:NADH-quinone oxidoreductase subunit J